MSKVEQYNPLESLAIGGTEIVPSGLIVVVGPNSSGKTLLLRDIEKFLLVGRPGGVVCTDVTTKPPDDLVDFVRSLEDGNHLRSIPGAKQGTYQSSLPYLSGVPRHGVTKDNFTTDLLSKAWNNFNSEKNANNHEFFRMVGISLVGYLSLDARRAVCAPAARMDIVANSPDLPIQGLQLHSEAIDLLMKETGRVFGNTVWLDVTDNSWYRLRVSGTGEPPSIGEMHNSHRVKRYREIVEAGDGIQSYSAICISMMLGRRPVLLIDEPELCLHPPQAYQMGRFIGEHANRQQAVFVATHSSHVLKGILDTGGNTQIVRMNHVQEQFSAHVLQNLHLREAVRNPRSRAESVLDGVFAKSVIVVESDGDREIYQAACEATYEYPSQEIQFVTVGGTGGFAEVCRLFHALRVPTSVIADLDILVDVDKVEATLEALSGGPVQAFMSLLKDTVQRLKALPPEILEAHVKSELQAVANMDFEWKAGGDNVLRRKLNEIEKKVKRVNRLKNGGISAYEFLPDIHASLTRCVEDAAKLGLFLVPCGELEDWVPHLMQDCTVSSKTQRAYYAAEMIRTSTPLEGDIWGFTKKVLHYLRVGAIQKNT